MSLLDWLPVPRSRYEETRKQLFLEAQRAAGPPVDFLPSHAAIFGAGITSQPDHTTLLQESLGIVDAATRAIANRLSSLEPQVKVRRRVESGTISEEILDDHRLKALLHRPHPNLTWRQMMRVAGQWVVTVGEAYWLKVGNGLGVPVELHPMPPGRVFPLFENGVVRAYEVLDGDGQRIVIEADRVIRFYLPDPENPWRSEGYLGPMGIEADANKFASQHLRKHYQTDANPKLALEAQEGAQPFTPEQKERFWEMWRQQYGNRTGMADGAPAVIPTHYKIRELALQTGADIQPLLEFWRDNLLMGIGGVPRSILGQVVSGDRSSAETNEWVFDKQSVLPLAQLFEDGLTLQLAGDFDPALFVEFAPFVSDDKQFELTREQQDITHGVRTINKVLQDRGEDTVDWGEEPLLSSKVGPFGASPAEPTPPDGDPVDAEGDETEEPEDEDPERMARDLHAKVRKLAKAAKGR